MGCMGERCQEGASLHEATEVLLAPGVQVRVAADDAPALEAEVGMVHG